ncbi:methyltransferase family protein [Actinocorallia herbida]|uniref:Methyltransferase family protein n=1 Tax=Actinocorallia herbida TaxID=58109 RepID=A0A3N1CT40_9ACTN|nr:class I SAM-dependent methyltransferase [Actinocorallia herbida]ROO84481.1 methyltransferase family protein [Actinocorallia herbida]
MFAELTALTARPGPFARTTTAELWTDPHLSERMLAAHLDPDVDLSSYRASFRARSTAWLTARFGLGPGSRVADLGCGPGLYGNALARSGAAVTGVDLSLRSVLHAAADARRDGLPARYLQEDYLTWRSGERFDLIIMIMRDLGALAPYDRRRALWTVTEHLAEGGAFVFDVDSPAGFAAVREQTRYAPSLMDGFWAPGPYFGFHTTFRYESELLSLDRYDIYEPHRTRTFYNWVQHFTPASIRAELHAAGLADTEILGDVAGSPFDPESPYFAVIAAPVS